MSETIKKVTLELFARINAGDVDGVLALLSDDVSWRLAGKTESLPTAGVYDKKRLKRLFERMLASLEDGLKMRVLSMIAEGDRVAAEVVSEGDLKNGRNYRQEYHLAITFKGDKIGEVHEYYDTQHAFEVWIKP
jgi:ketosteroid isomerase-like protein